MRKPVSVLVAGGLAVLCLLSSPALAQSGGQPAAPSATDPGNPMTVDESIQRHAEKMQAMPRTGDADRDFATGMREHHQGAIDMARDYLKTGKDPQLRRMAQRIITDQNKEIAEFEAWLRRHRQPDGAPRN